MTHQFGSKNVTSSINWFIRNNLGTYAPSWLNWRYGVTQPRSLNFNYPDQPLNFPSWSITHVSSDDFINSEGDRADNPYKGIIKQGLMSVSVWSLELKTDDNGKPVVPQEKNEKWWSQMQDMRDSILLLLQKNKAILLYDFTDPNNPVALNAIVRLQDFHERYPVPDPNPAVHRWLITATYRWTERWT